MDYIESYSHDPQWNLALEQYVFDEMDRSRSYVMLWQNHNTIVVGKNQNTVNEVNSDYVRRHGITVVRRRSGGALRLRRGNFAARLPQLSDIAHKREQATAAAALKTARQFDERRNMILPRLAVRHRAEHAHRTGLIDNVPQQLMHRQVGRQHAQLRELVEKCLRFRHGLCGGRQRTIILVVHITQANFRQIFLCKSANRRIECRQQRNILPRIVHNFQP